MEKSNVLIVNDQKLSKKDNGGEEKGFFKKQVLIDISRNSALL